MLVIEYPIARVPRRQTLPKKNPQDEPSRYLLIKIIQNAFQEYLIFYILPFTFYI